MRHGRGNGHSRVNAYAAEWCEIAAAHRFDLERADENHCDAYATADSPIAEETPVETKGCKLWIGNGTYNGTETRMRGRFTFSPTHGDLVDAEGYYALVLYDTVGDPEADGCIVALRVALVRATTIDALISDDADYPKLGWPHIFQSPTPP